MSETSTYETIRLEPAVDGVATLYLDRPEKMNALTPGMVEEVCDAIDATDADDEVGAVVVTGEGRAFCAG
ncbi:MAG TPA: enoyl-CoA hydratase-related protein, partial [Solirubrobacterales bacterium]|nr:enoyl-CoA hydratase-related protein [Solirubrobacterales bacterium]